jgi:cytoskeletal protein RodZ
MLKNLRKKKRKGQSTLEFTILIIIIIGALLSIQVYIKRAVQGSLKSAADDISQEQFTPGGTTYNFTSTTESTTMEQYIQGQQTTNIIGAEITNVELQMNIINQFQEYWGA